MALCLPRRRRATSLATLPKTLSVASITNHSCVTSAGLALKVFMEVAERGLRLVACDRHRFVGRALTSGSGSFSPRQLAKSPRVYQRPRGTASRRERRAEGA